MKKYKNNLIVVGLSILLVLGFASLAMAATNLSETKLFLKIFQGPVASWNIAIALATFMIMSVAFTVAPKEPNL